MRESVFHILLLLVVAGSVCFTNLGNSRLWDRDEPRNAGCAAEMLARGDYVVPIFNNQLRHQKPVLLYWLIMSAYQVFGINEWGARFWSAFLAVGTVLATYQIGRRMFDARTGLIAGISLSTSLMFVVAARAATPDSVLIFCTTMALMFYVSGLDWTPQSGTPSLFPKDWRFVVAIYGMLGLGVLAKGPVGFLLPMAMIGLFGMIQNMSFSLPVRPTSGPTGIGPIIRKRAGQVLLLLHPRWFWSTLWAMRPVTGAALILLIAAPWFVLVHLRTEGDFSQQFFLGEHIGRATEAMENHNGGWWFYPLAILVGFFPWSCFWGPTLVGLFSGSRFPVSPLERSSTTQTADAGKAIDPHCLLICWVLIQVVAFTFVQTKLPSYVTPCYPALALLVSYCVVQFSRRAAEPSPSAGAVHRGWFYAAVGGLIFSGLTILLGMAWALNQFLPEQIWIAGLGVIPLLAGLWLWWLMRGQQEANFATIFSVAAILFCLGLFGFGTVAIDRQQKSQWVLDPIRTSRSAVASYGCLESSWVYYGNKPITELQLIPNRATFVPAGFQASTTTAALTTTHHDRDATPARPARKFWEPVPRSEVDQFVTNHPNGLILTVGDHLDSLLEALPADYHVIRSVPYFLKNETIYLVGNEPDAK